MRLMGLRATAAGFLLAVFAGGGAAQTALVQRLDVAEMSHRAGWIGRGTVTSVQPGLARVGDRDLPILTYRLRVARSFKGQAPPSKGEERSFVIRMLDSSYIETVSVQQLQRLPVLPRLPGLELGRDYLLIATPESAAGLSSPVGLQQGCFEIRTAAGRETADNRVGNLGLSPGPLAYDSLVAAIQAALASEKGGGR